MDPSSTSATSDQHDPGGGAATAPAANFPTGLRVLLVEEDRVCVAVITKMLQECRFHVTTCTSAEVAMAMLREGKGSFDLVLSDVYMPDDERFKLLECIGLEMDLPVVMMSSDEQKDAVMKGVVHGACDYLIKPMRMELLKNIWQHVARKRKKRAGKEPEQHSEDNGQEEGDNGEGTSNGGAKRKKDGGDVNAEVREGSPQQVKKQRVVWSAELHENFVNVVNELGPQNAVPKKILERMNVPNLTRENVASHLQKHRNRRRQQQQKGATLTGINGFNFQEVYSSNEILPQNMVTLQSTPRLALNNSMDMIVSGNHLIGGSSNINLRQCGHSMDMNVSGNHLIGGSGNINLRQCGHSMDMNVSGNHLIGGAGNINLIQCGDSFGSTMRKYIGNS